MSDKYNFSKHVSHVVRPVLSQLGFRKKGAIFTKEIDKYLDSISWKYKKEEELINLLQELKDQIIKVGIPTISMAENLVNKGLDSFNLSNEMRKYSNQLFLSQLKPDSRFPEV